jgi:hypothetical protein
VRITCRTCTQLDPASFRPVPMASAEPAVPVSTIAASSPRTSS